MAVGTPIDLSWTLTLDDEFNGTSLNPKNWTPNWTRGPVGNIQAPMQPSAELAPYDPTLVSVHDGALHLNAVRSPVTADDGLSYYYRTAMVQSSGVFEQAYGYFEARIRLPGADGEIGNWPSFWMNGITGECDIMEGIGGHASYHFHSPSGDGGSYINSDFTGWHVFAALWKPGRVDFYYDDAKVGSITSGVSSGPLYMVLVNSIGGYGDAPRIVPSDMQVDWVHVYSNDPSAVAATPEDGYTGLGDTTPRSMAGGAGNDSLWGGFGEDSLWGGAGKDILTGSGGRDLLTGGFGPDKFAFNSILDSTSGPNRDVIMDFSHHQQDRIDLATIDARPANRGDQAFVYIGSEGFHDVAGELRFAKGVLQGDVDGDGVADFQIKVVGATHLAASDIIL